MQSVNKSNNVVVIESTSSQKNISNEKIENKIKDHNEKLWEYQKVSDEEIKVSQSKRCQRRMNIFRWIFALFLVAILFAKGVVCLIDFMEKNKGEGCQIFGPTDTSQIEEISSSTSDSAQTFTSLGNRIVETDRMLQQIQSGINEQNVASRHILEMVEVINSSAHEIMEESVKMKENGDVVAIENGILEKAEENFRILLCDIKCNLIANKLIAKGELNTVSISLREIFRPAISYSAANIVLAHNHPSGDYTPSREDIAFTKRVADAGKDLGIAVVDHIIVGDSGYCSIREDRYLDW